ncbi:hypothetical protein ACHAW5_004183 [Stephanodiscus triporus]|uniref:CCAAT-binding factor domain-containing protein n=1 Tax=Stephanodiscus triporus TaxID=2934178 RepID=A0ABD3PSE2_9STRA
MVESNLSSSSQTAQEIKTLLQQLRKSSRQKNKQRGGIGGVGSRVNDGRDREDALRLDGLRKIFSRLIELSEFDFECVGGDKRGNGVSSQWKAWLVTQHDEFISHLLEGIVDGKTTALRTYCGVLASSPVNISGLSRNQANDDDRLNTENENDPEERLAGMISERLLNKLLEAAVKSRLCFNNRTAATAANSSRNKTSRGEEETGDDILSSDELLQLVSEESILALLETEFIRPHRDVQYFVYKGLHQIALDSLAGLERVRKNANSDVVKKDGEKKNEEAADVVVAKAEMKVGLVAENICRLLMMMDYVPKRHADDLNVENGAGYLFPPPVLSESDDVVIEDDDDDDYSDAFDDNSSEEQEGKDTAASKKRRKSQMKESQAKRSKKTKHISWQQSYKHRHAHQEAWLSVLRLPNLPSRTQRRVLQHLSTYVLSNDICPSPLRFAEYFTASFKGGVGNGSNSLAAILSLHGLFILMLDNQLEYPQFYNSLYQLLHPRILYTKHRTRFLRLLSKSLSSNSMLPAYVVASFCKRLCRLALSGPPSGGLFVLALVSNLLRKHGECACLIHRRGKDEDGGLIEDVFVEDVHDLIKTRALESCLWELSALEKHYHPAISTLAKSIGNEDDKTTPMHDMEDFLTHTYKSLFEQEKKRLGSGGGGGGGKKKVGGGRVSLTFVEPEGLFTKDDVFADILKCS